MKELINLARGFSQQFECALVYGITNVTQLDNLFKVNAKQFVIVEADPGVFSKLEEWHSTLPESAPTVNCYHAAITQEDTPTTLLYQASQPGFSSTAKPNQIKRFRPGLIFSSVSVPAQKLSYFTDRYAVSANQHNIALLNCNGAEHQILSDSTSQLFSTILVKTCSKALFGENTQLPAALTDNGYSHVNIKSAQPPMSLAALCKPLLVLEQALALDKARQEAEQFKQQAIDLVAQNEALTEQRDNQAKQFSENFETVSSELQAVLSREKNLQEQLEAEGAKHKKLSEDNEGLSSQVATLNSEKSSLQAAVSDGQQKLAELNEQLVAAQQERDKQKEHHLNNKQWAESLQKKNAELEEKLKALNDALKGESSRIQKLEKENKELAFSQEKIDIDLVKVETQVAMFKELIFSNNKSESD